MGNCIDCRLEKDMDGRTRLHRFRYHVARGFVTPNDKVLDFGSGSGYGTSILAEDASFVTGVEKVMEEVVGANKKYKTCNCEFICDNLETMEIPECDVACGFEVIEHLHKPEEFIKKLKAKVKRYIIVSVPIGERLAWIEEKKEYQVIGDVTHHSVFDTPESLSSLFIDNDWKEFIGIRLNPSFLAVFYNNNAIS